jgi:hypothetical protein
MQSAANNAQLTPTCQETDAYSVLTIVNNAIMELALAVQVIFIQAG